MEWAGRTKTGQISDDCAFWRAAMISVEHEDGTTADLPAMWPRQGIPFSMSHFLERLAVTRIHFPISLPSLQLSFPGLSSGAQYPNQ